MTTQTDTQAIKVGGDIIQDFVAGILKEHGFNFLPAEEQKQYLLQFSAEAERRIGIALRPKLTEKSAREFEKLIDNYTSTPEEWNNFWQTNVPDYTELVKSALHAYANEIALAFKS